VGGSTTWLADMLLPSERLHAHSQIHATTSFLYRSHDMASIGTMPCVMSHHGRLPAISSEAIHPNSSPRRQETGNNISDIHGSVSTLAEYGPIPSLFIGRGKNTSNRRQGKGRRASARLLNMAQYLPIQTCHKQIHPLGAEHQPQIPLLLSSSQSLKRSHIFPFRR
jgi:hypothetical protein